MKIAQVAAQLYTVRDFCQTAAALVYRRRQHVINLLTWPAATYRVSAGRGRRDGYQIESWVQGGFNVVAVSEIPVNELAEFADLIRSRGQ